MKQKKTLRGLVSTLVTGAALAYSGYLTYLGYKLSENSQKQDCVTRYSEEDQRLSREGISLLRQSIKMNPLLRLINYERRIDELEENYEHGLALHTGGNSSADSTGVLVESLERLKAYNRGTLDDSLDKEQEGR